jgi:hypothetical protein
MKYRRRELSEGRTKNESPRRERMTDPTPEERAYELGLATYTGLADEAKIAAAIRAAVEAEREACAKACEEIGKEIVCPEECAAAIRARGEKG